MSDQAIARPFSENDTEADVHPAGRGKLRRLLLVLAVGAGLLIVIAPLFLWMHYRHGYVVSRNAWVRGHVAHIGAPQDGVVAEVLVDDGDRVEAGQVMARLRDRQLQAKLESAQSQLEQATRELEVERLAIKQERRRLQSEMAKATAQRKAAASRADEAKERHKVLASLAGVGATSREKIREAEAERRTSAAESDAAQADQNSAWVEYQGLSVRERRISVLESRVATARADVAERQAVLEESRIRAPDAGRVVRRTVEPGSSLEVGEPVMSVWIGDQVWVEAWVNEEDLADVKVGNAARITVKPYPDRVFYGVVEAVGVAPDYEVPESDVPQPYHQRMRTSPVFLVRIALEDPDGHLIPGLSAVVGISVTEELPPHLTSPAATLVESR